jgi:hyaluronan synthase
MSAPSRAHAWIGRHRDRGERRRLLNSRLVAWVSAIASAFIISGFHQTSWHDNWSIETGFFAGVSAMVVVMLILSANGKSFRHLPVAPGKVVALVPAYNENPYTLHACVWSLLNGTVVPDAIHVVDDGSAYPCAAFDHPLVTWHRTPNQGKRAAQIHGLRHQLDADFVLTVDSDSIVDKYALEELLRAMSAPNVQAVTGTCLVRNRSENLITRLTDLEFVSGNFVARRARSAVGAVAPTSGPLSLYRAAIVIDNAEDYLTSGTYGDDRRLTHYSLLRGRVVVCDTAIVEMEMPDTLRSLYRQRVRWCKGYVKYLPWELAHLNGAALLLRVWNTVLIAVMPFVFVTAFVLVPVTTHKVYWVAWVYWCLLLYAGTLTYAIGRPWLSRRQRWLTWLIGTPFLIVLQLFVLRPALFHAGLTIRNEKWGTRDIEGGQPDLATPRAGVNRMAESVPSSA